jgi:hypothetical protein
VKLSYNARRAIVARAVARVRKKVRQLVDRHSILRDGDTFEICYSVHVEVEPARGRRKTRDVRFIAREAS